MVNDDGNEVVLLGDEKKYLLGLLKHVFDSPTEEIYEVVIFVCSVDYMRHLFALQIFEIHHYVVPCSHPFQN